MSKSDLPPRTTSTRYANGGPSDPSSTQAVGSSIAATGSTQVESPGGAGKPPNHHRFVFTDPVAFRYLEEDPSTQTLVRRQKLTGYESYVVEQWACSRTHPTFVITTYTGDPSHQVVCGVLSAPINEEEWSPRLKVYFKALMKYHARRRDTPLGTLMITNLSAFPSSLTVIPVPEGDLTKYRQDFFINENLKRLGCSGRTGMTLAKPSSSTISKFYQLYRASDKIPSGQAVIELVKLCQVALMLFDKLEPEYADGLLCDLTEKALNDWWVEFGTEYYNTEPHDGILGPTTVAGLLGLLMGARNRLHAFGAPVSKDVFDIEHTKRAIAYFQKTHRMSKTRRLDHATLSRLHRATMKAANSEGWAVPRAIKGTVAELSGKGGEMVMDMVGARDKSGITEVETCDIEQFIMTLSGARAKWLWHGKPRKGQSSDAMFNRLAGENNLEFQDTEGGGYEWSSKRKEFATASPQDRLARAATFDSSKSKGPTDDRQRLQKKQHVDKESMHKDHESLRGFGRIKDAVGFSGHKSRPSREFDESDRMGGGDSSPRPSTIPESELDSSYGSKRDVGMDGYPDRAANFGKVLTNTPPAIDYASSTFLPQIEPPSDDEKGPRLGPAIDFGGPVYAHSSTASLTGSTYQGHDLVDVLPQLPDHDISSRLKRRHSIEALPSLAQTQKHEAYWPRRISFSVAEDSVLTWKSINRPMLPGEISELRYPLARLRAAKSANNDAKEIRARLLRLETVINSWVTNSMSSVKRIDGYIARDQETLDELYYPRLEEFHALQEHSQQVLGHEKAGLEETVHEIEVLGAKLEYEVNALRSKVEDVEDGVDEFERQVRYVEERVTELEWDMRPREGWTHWLLRITMGIGQLPSEGSVGKEDVKGGTK